MIRRRNFLKGVGGGILTLLCSPALAAFKVKEGDSKVSKKSGNTVLELPEPMHFDEKYTFENFVEGSSNKFVVAACLAVCDKPGEVYNPLFICGGVGMGKTHLLHAIGHRSLSRNSKAKVRYVTSEGFTNEFIHAMRFDGLSKFRTRYRETDVLLMDDIQFIAEKERSQEELLHTLDSLIASRRQVVFTSDYEPKDFKRVDERLRTRFESGLIASIPPPDIEFRIAIVNCETDRHSFRLPDDVVHLIAEHYKNNIRGIKGAVINISAYSKFTGKDVTVPLAKEVLTLGSFA